MTKGVIEILPGIISIAIIAWSVYYILGDFPEIIQSFQ